MEHILVTGANGFIGSNLVKRLLEEGNSVRALVRKTSELTFLKDSKAEIVFGDINDMASLENAMVGIDKVFHVAGLAADWGPYSKFEKINLDGTKNVAQTAEMFGVKKLIYISTVAFHGFGKTNMNEESPVADNLIPYAITKYLAEKWLWEFGKTSSIKITAVRPGNVYGVNDRTFIVKYIDAMLAGKFASVNHGKSMTCPVFIDNLIDTITLVGREEKANGQAFIATDGLDINWHTFNNKLADALGVKLPKTSIPFFIGLPVAAIYYWVHRALGIQSEPFLTPYRLKNGGMDYHFSINKLKTMFNYTPKVSLDAAMETTAEWYKSRKKE